MREYDDNIQNYTPVLRRIVILVAIITAVPVALWTITAFMRTYVAQPTILTARPIAAATSPTAPISTADAGTAGPSTTAALDAKAPQPLPPVVEARATTPDARSPDVDTKSDRLGDTDRNAPAGMPKAAAPAVAESTPAPAFPAVPPPAPDKIAAQAEPAPASTDSGAADSLPPPHPIAGPIPLPQRRPSILARADKAAARAIAKLTPTPAPTATQPPAADKIAAPAGSARLVAAADTGQTTGTTIAAQPEPAAADSAADPLPPDPIAGPIPLPRHRPSVFALAEIGNVPLPRARPGSAPADAAPSTMNDAQPSGYDPGMTHY
jgi:hypothetical protein